MIPALAITEALVASTPGDIDLETTLDLAMLAQVARGDRIEIEKITDRTLELFQRTLRIINGENEETEPATVLINDPDRFVPEHGDLRKRFLLAETLGSYSALHDLLDGYSPAYRLSMGYDEKAQKSRLNAFEVRSLEEYRDQIHCALVHANKHLLANVGSGYSSDELQELNDILFEARARCETIDAILGRQLIIEIEDGVRQLYAFQDKIRTVQRSTEGIFFINSEVMFMPTNDLVNIVNNLFKAVGNPFVAEHIDGLLLLAARNLLIQAVSFYSYYGKQQIYTTFKRSQSTVNRSMITDQIRSEIRQLFRACKTENRLVLKRVMNDAEREFEISVKSIRTAAERSAIEVVNRLIPEATEPLPVPPKPIRQRISDWLFR